MTYTTLVTEIRNNRHSYEALAKLRERSGVSVRDWNKALLAAFQ